MKKKNGKTYLGRRVEKAKNRRIIGALKAKSWNSFDIKKIPSILSNIYDTLIRAMTEQILAYYLLDHYLNMDWLKKLKIRPSYSRRTFHALQWCRLYSLYFGKNLNNRFWSKNIQIERPAPNNDSGELSEMLLTVVPKSEDMFDAGASNFEVQMADPTIETEDPEVGDCSKFTLQELLEEFGYYPRETESRESAGYEIVVPRVPPGL